MNAFVIRSLAFATLALGASLAHASIDLRDQVALPEVEIVLQADAHSAGAYHLKAKVKNFRFAPDHANQPHQTVDTQIGPIVEGHAHLFINDVKVTRLYAADFFVQDLHEGDRVTVQLNSNNHHSFTLQGSPIGVASKLVPASDGNGHHE